MKKIAKILLIVFVLVGSNVIEAYCKCTITIVIARARDCMGFGICKGTITIENDEPPMAKNVRGDAEIDEDGHLVLTVNTKTGMTPETYNTYFSKGIFVCEDDFPVPAAILKALNYRDTYTVRAGNYPVVKKGDTVIVKF